MKKVKLTKAEFETEKDSGQDKHTLREALAHDYGLPIIARIEDQIGPPYAGPDVDGYPWGSSLWSHALQLNEAKELELHITTEEAERLEEKHKGDVKGSILAKVKNAENKLVASAEPIESEATRGNRR